MGKYFYFVDTCIVNSQKGINFLDVKVNNICPCEHNIKAEKMEFSVCKVWTLISPPSGPNKYCQGGGLESKTQQIKWAFKAQKTDGLNSRLISIPLEPVSISSGLPCRTWPFTWLLWHTIDRFYRTFIGG